jgi:menaquinol-cytochrome c reductase iron-sulfur subunit
MLLLESSRHETKEIIVMTMPRDDHDDDRVRAPDEAAHAVPVPASARAAMTRQKMVTRMTIGLGGVVGAIIAAPAAVAVLAPVFKQVKSYPVDIGPVTLYPQVAPGRLPWHAATFERAPGDTSGLARRLVYIRNDGNRTFTAISNICMHVGCPVQANATGFACPCHGGQYDSEGRRIAGPPVRPLNRYDTSVDDRGHLILGQLWAMDDALHRHQLKPPGEPVDGPLGLLYPGAPQG